ncbi:MAG: hypothetical protein R3E76_01395 [Planctomycetota bacterium]
MKSREGKNKIFFIALALAAALAISGYAWFADEPFGHTVSAPTSNEAHFRVPNHGTPLQAIEVIPESLKTSELAEEAELPDEDGRKTVRLRFVRPDGELVPRVTTYLASFEGDKSTGGQIAVAGNNGQLTLRLQAEATSLLVRSNDEHWFIREAHHVLQQGDQVIVIDCEALVDVELRAVYEDGEPFRGKASIFKMQETVRPDRRGVNGEFLSGSGFLIDCDVFPLTGVRATDFALWFYCERAGYSRYEESVQSSQIWPGARIDVVIRRLEHGVGNLTIDFGEQSWEEGEPWFFEATNLTTTLPGSMNSRKNQPPVDNRFSVPALKADTYRLTITYKDMVWQKSVTVVSGEDTFVRAELAEACKARVTVFDENGKLKSGAVLRFNSGEYTDYPPRPQSGVLAVTGEKGEATLGGLSYETTELLVVAEGYEPQVIGVSLNAGRVTDLGPVRLVPATGRITVRVINQKPGHSYIVMAIHPVGHGGHSSKTSVPASGEVVFDALPLREYLVGVTYQQGGRIASKAAILTADASEAIIEIDVSDLPLPK